MGFNSRRLMEAGRSTRFKRGWPLISRFVPHAFDFACAQLRIEHRLTKFKHPWTNGQVERMNRTIKDATVRRFYYDTHESLRAHLATFLDASTSPSARELRGLTPFERICQNLDTAA